MRFVILFIITIFLSSFSCVQARYTRVNGYTRSNGTYVNGYTKTSPNSTRFDNFSTKGNMNPFTGKNGTVDPYRTNYGSRSNYRRNSNWY